MSFFEKKNISFRKDGDMLEVILRDDSYTPYFKDEARINDKKQMKELLEKLRQKGVNFPDNWLD